MKLECASERGVLVAGGSSSSAMPTQPPQVTRNTARIAGSMPRWAIRAFLLVSGVWFLRLGLMAWVLINQGPNGNTPRLDGVFDSVWVLGCYLIPLAIAEMYFRAENGGQRLQLAAAGMHIVLPINA